MRATYARQTAGKPNREMNPAIPDSGAMARLGWLGPTENKSRLTQLDSL